MGLVETLLIYLLLIYLGFTFFFFFLRIILSSLVIKKKREAEVEQSVFHLLHDWWSVLFTFQLFLGLCEINEDEKCVYKTHRFVKKNINDSPPTI